MKIFGQLEQACVEQLSADPGTNVQGRIFTNTTDGRTKLDDGTNKRAFIRNDQKAIFGNDSTAANNVRIQKGSSGLLFLTSGADTTAEGSSPPTLSQLGFRLENALSSGLPANGSIGRGIFATDQKVVCIDDGSNWRKIIPEFSADDSTSGATVTLASIVTSVVRLTGSITTLQMIPAGFSSQRVVLVNRTGANITVSNDSGGTAANRILTGTGLSLALGVDASISLRYDATTQRWQIVGQGSTAVPSWSYTSQASTLNPALVGSYYKLSGASFTITLPTAAGIPGQGFTFEHLGTSLTQVYTFNTTSGQTIGGVASGSYALYTSGEVLYLVSDGANWMIAEHKTATGLTSATTTITGSTSNPSKGTTTADTITWRRVGQYVHIVVKFRQTVAGSAGTGDYQFSMPANLSIDTTITGTDTTVYGAGVFAPQNLFGTAYASNATAFAAGGVIIKDSSTIKIGLTGSSGVVSSGVISLSNTNVFYGIDVYLPISGWQP